jgi:stress response protein SCP2
MSVNLQKGQKVDLTKGNASLKKVVVGLGWDAAEQHHGIFGGRTQSIDCDASAILCTTGGKLVANDDIVYYNNLRHSSAAVIHMGDNLTGDGDGDDEQIVVDLQDIPQRYEKIVFVVTIYQARERKQDFGMIKNAFIRIVDASNSKELFKYNLSENYSGKTAMVFGEIYRYNGEWNFSAVGEPTNDNGISEMARRFM